MLSDINVFPLLLFDICTAIKLLKTHDIFFSFTLFSSIYIFQENNFPLFKGKIGKKRGSKMKKSQVNNEKSFFK